MDLEIFKDFKLKVYKGKFFEITVQKITKNCIKFSNNHEIKIKDNCIFFNGELISNKELNKEQLVELYKWFLTKKKYKIVE